MAYKTLTIASDNGVEIQRISKSLGPYKDTPRYRIVVSRVCRDSSRGKDVRKKKEGGKGKKENAVGKTETFKVFQGITTKSYYRKRISLRLCSSRRQEVREFRVSIGNLSAPHRSFILPAFRPLRRSLPRREKDL